MTSGEHRATRAVFFGCGVHEFELHLRRWKGDTIELKIAGLLHHALGHEHMRDDGLLNIRLPDSNHCHAVVRYTVLVDQSIGDRERTNGRGKIATIATPVHELLVDGYLAKEVVDIVTRPGTLRQEYGLAGAGCRASHPIGLFGIRIGAADHPQQQLVARGTRHLCGDRQIADLEEHSIQPTGHRYLNPFTISTMHHNRQRRSRFAFTDDVKGLCAVNRIGLACVALFEFQRQNTHADEIGAVNAFEAFGNNHFNASQTNTFGSPVPRGSLPIVCTGNDDQWLMSLHVGLNGFPHAGHLPFRLDTSQ